MTNNGFRRRDAIFFMIGLAMLGACGGSSDSSSPEAGDQSDDGGGTSEPAAEPAAEPTAEQAAESSGGGGDGASFMIDGNVHPFGADDVRICLVDEKGIFRASIANADFTQSAEISLPPEGFTTDDPLFAADEYATVSFFQSESENWLASAYESDPLSVNNRNIPEGQTQVDSYNFDGGGASGTATFLNTQTLTVVDGSFTGEPVSGSFAISCG